ncbi:zinc transport system ATP-binding protein [Nocardioides marinisabuli]|uniref:Zinc transport system ATP-binding protein n=1 Tax=Nocardioides marinisabuli TaxID=419476 RepID=A0A7Y9F4E8_9ACTN|nr:metal ABC transporter ATP-binding protein [Nocardioides marinisabuli]NYD59457.1 zinc transport system ATP-binding protein [Nocardioides marinisabuli]
MSPDTDPVVELRDGAVVLGGRPVVRQVDLTVRAGEFVTLLGPNGSGKSTLVRALTGLRPLERGSLRLFGIPMTSFRDWHRLGYVPQRASAASGVPVSVREVVASGRLTRRRVLSLPSRADRAAVAEALEVVGLADRAKDSVATLSGGQQQRVLIARALAGGPDLFFLDEPTAGVDLPNQEALAHALATLSRSGSTIVLVTHELGPLAPLVDRTVVLRDGRLVYDGPPLDLNDAHGHHHPHDLDAGRHDHHPDVVAPWDREDHRL